MLGNGLQEFAKFIGCQTSIADNPAHGERVDRIVSGDRDDSSVIGHDDVFTLTGNPESCLLERAHGIEVVDTGDAWHD